MSAPPTLPAAVPALDPTGAVIVFDGVCVICSGWVRFLLPRDRSGRYRFAPMQGETGRALLAAQGLDPDDPDSFLLVEYDRAPSPRVSMNSLAVLRVVAGLGGVYRLALIAVLLPRPLRDAVYRLVARNRYRWFGRRDACMVPDPEQAHRFLD